VGKIEITSRSKRLCMNEYYVKAQRISGTQKTGREGLSVPAYRSEVLSMPIPAQVSPI
jgi:hypothetical protein